MSNIVISGANEGIGFHMAKALLEAGHRVAVLDIALDGASVLAETHPGSCLCIEADVRDFAALERAVAEAASSFGGIDAAVQNACLCPFEIFSDLSLIHILLAVARGGKGSPLILAGQQFHSIFLLSSILSALSLQFRAAAYACP